MTAAEKRARLRRLRAERARQKAQQSVLEKFQAVVQQVSNATIKAALAGDSSAMRLVLERVAPMPRYESPPIALEGFDSDAETASAQVVAYIALGRISPEKGALLLDILKQRAEISFTAQVVD